MRQKNQLVLDNRSAIYYIESRNGESQIYQKQLFERKVARSTKGRDSHRFYQRNTYNSLLNQTSNLNRVFHDVCYIFK